MGPTVWEIDDARRSGSTGYEVIPNVDKCNNYRAVFDASGQADILDQWIQNVKRC